jgi:DNA invertase Pin-like site-specific DNA recombinase
MLIGYARVSTTDQTLNSQEDDLRAAGCERICVEKFARTRFVKTTSGGIMGPRFWDITKHAKPGATDVDVADALRQETWA